MRLLVSVSNASEATAALAGGADIVDAKDPGRGALGAVSPSVFGEIAGACRGGVPVTAALGDASSLEEVAAAARTFARAGATLVKVGFAATRSLSGAIELLQAARDAAAEAAPQAGVVAVAYADAGAVPCLAPADVLAAARRSGVRGLLLDTADKRGPGLRQLLSFAQLFTLVRTAHDAGLLVAIAGRIAVEDIDWLAPSRADIVGVRGAACVGGRAGTVDAACVTALLARCRAVSRAAPALRPPSAASV